MPIYENVNGTWTVVKHVWKNVNGTWTKVRRLFRNQGGVWTQYHGDNDFAAYSLGALQNKTSMANLGLSINGSVTFAGGRSYNLVFFDKYGTVTLSRQYDIFGDASGAGPTSSPYGITQFYADVASAPAGQRFLLFTSDEPQQGNTVNSNPSFVAIVESLGATPSVFHSASFAYRSAYLLLGTKGSAPTYEAYAGTESNNIGPGGNESGTLDGAIGITFNIVNGTITNVVRIV